MSSSRRPGLAAYLLMLLPPLFWAGNAVVGRAAVGEIEPFALAMWRWLLAFLIITPIGLPRLLRQRHRFVANMGHIALMALFSVTAYNTLLYKALTTVGALNATLVGATIPIAILIVARIWLGETVGWGRGLGILVSFLGVLTVVSRGDPAMLLSLRLKPGDILMLLAVMFWAVFSVQLRKYPTDLDPVALLYAQVGFGCLFLVPFHLYDVGFRLGFVPGTKTLSMIAFVAVFPSVLAYHFWNQGIARLGPNVAAQFTNLIPPLTAILGMVFLHERLAGFHLIGMALIFLGIRWATRTEQRE